jgi:ABC-type Fe3+/spermidine/putrescine transport system ATPase subunit
VIGKRVGEIAEMLDLTPFLDRRRYGSSDAKQKISLGRGLVRSDVAAVLFDEPLTVIDPHLKWQLRASSSRSTRSSSSPDLRHPRPDRGADLRRQVVVMHAGLWCRAARPRNCSSGRRTPSSATSSARRA